MAFHTTERGASSKRQVEAPEWIERDIREAQDTKPTDMEDTFNTVRAKRLLCIQSILLSEYLIVQPYLQATNNAATKMYNENKVELPKWSDGN
ncbi:hypothetical protein A0J61_11833 [Choanephora cucurbitarum]|uniref:Uncharacterized protein n=1 Tax=Choanephora cucurbitarum TaxID=101091 RepID=A0A1C7MTG0_9FUNG|nr:hypothetical protein A0J61_11833 [Choanephora cucurbitarum]